MNKIKKITFLICFLIYAIIISVILLQTWLVAHQPYDSEKGGTVGITSLLVAVGFFILGIILSIPKQTRDTGIAILISSGIIFLIGFSLLSIYPLKF